MRVVHESIAAIQKCGEVWGDNVQIDGYVLHLDTQLLYSPSAQVRCRSPTWFKAPGAVAQLCEEWEGDKSGSGCPPPLAMYPVLGVPETPFPPL